MIPSSSKVAVYVVVCEGVALGLGQLSQDKVSSGVHCKVAKSPTISSCASVPAQMVVSPNNISAAKIEVDKNVSRNGIKRNLSFLYNIYSELWSLNMLAFEY